MKNKFRDTMILGMLMCFFVGCATVSSDYQTDIQLSNVTSEHVMAVLTELAQQEGYRVESRKKFDPATSKMVEIYNADSDQTKTGLLVRFGTKTFEDNIQVLAIVEKDTSFVEENAQTTRMLQEEELRKAARFLERLKEEIILRKNPEVTIPNVDRETVVKALMGAAEQRGFKIHARTKHDPVTGQKTEILNADDNTPTEEIRVRYGIDEQPNAIRVVAFIEKIVDLGKVTEKIIPVYQHDENEKAQKLLDELKDSLTK